mmetsp:Transcript_108745/g.307422  ORF Transcript_108745/g.307422 Transcript_108745/m.307422 type:complete len:162 (-) Transcript_108745:304-789(-)
MGGKPFRDSAAAISPWTTQVRVENRTATPVQIWLARDAAAPAASDAIEHIVPASSTYALSSGWLREPRATLLIRTGAATASVLRVPHTGRVVVSLAPRGLRVETPDGAAEDCGDACGVPGLDTVPMVLRGESFRGEPLGEEPPWERRSRARSPQPEPQEQA